MTFEALPDGKIRINSSCWADPQVILKGEVFEVRAIDGRLRLARKPHDHDDGDLPVPAYDPYGPGEEVLEA